MLYANTYIYLVSNTHTLCPCVTTKNYFTSLLAITLLYTEQFVLIIERTIYIMYVCIYAHTIHIYHMHVYIYIYVCVNIHTRITASQLTVSDKIKQISPNYRYSLRRRRAHLPRRRRPYFHI